jgi:hypothetical protein
VNAPVEAQDVERWLWGVSMIVALALFATSTFFWLHTNGRVEYGVIGGTLIVLATIFWIPALSGLFGLLGRQMPRYAAWGWLVAVYGSVVGAAFGFEGLFAESLRIPHEARTAAWERFPLAFNLTLFGRDHCFHSAS